MKEPKYVLCARYDARIVLENSRLQAFEMHFGSCSKCKVKVILSGETFALLELNPNLKPLCPECAPAVIDGRRPQLMMTTGQLREAAALLAKLKAKNN